MTACPFDPRPLLGAPMGQFHCPDCGCMVLAGLQHGACEEGCEMQDDDDRAVWAEVVTLLGGMDGT